MKSDHYKDNNSENLKFHKNSFFSNNKTKYISTVDQSNSRWNSVTEKENINTSIRPKYEKYESNIKMEKELLMYKNKEKDIISNNSHLFFIKDLKFIDEQNLFKLKNFKLYIPIKKLYNNDHRAKEIFMNYHFNFNEGIIIFNNIQALKTKILNIITNEKFYDLIWSDNLMSETIRSQLLGVKLYTENLIKISIDSEITQRENKVVYVKIYQKPINKDKSVRQRIFLSMRSMNKDLNSSSEKNISFELIDDHIKDKNAIDFAVKERIMKKINKLSNKNIKKKFQSLTNSKNVYMESPKKIKREIPILQQQIEQGKEDLKTLSIISKTFQNNMYLPDIAKNNLKINSSSQKFYAQTSLKITNSLNSFKNLDIEKNTFTSRILQEFEIRQLTTSSVYQSNCDDNFQLETYLQLKPQENENTVYKNNCKLYQMLCSNLDNFINSKLKNFLTDNFIKTHLSEFREFNVYMKSYEIYIDFQKEFLFYSYFCKIIEQEDEIKNFINDNLTTVQKAQSTISNNEIKRDNEIYPTNIFLKLDFTFLLDYLKNELINNEKSHRDFFDYIKNKSSEFSIHNFIFKHFIFAKNIYQKNNLYVDFILFTFNIGTKVNFEDYINYKRYFGYEFKIDFKWKFICLKRLIKNLEMTLSLCKEEKNEFLNKLGINKRFFKLINSFDLSSLPFLHKDRMDKIEKMYDKMINYVIS